MFWVKQKLDISICNLFYFVHEALFGFIQFVLEVIALLWSSGNKNCVKVSYETLLGFGAEQ